MKISKEYLVKLIHESLEKAISKNTKQYYDLDVANLDKDLLNKNDYEFGMRDEKTEVQPDLSNYEHENIDLSNYEHENISDLVVKYFIDQLSSLSTLSTRRLLDPSLKVSLAFTFIQTLPIPIPPNISNYLNRDTPRVKKFHQIKASYLKKLCNDVNLINRSDLYSLIKFILFNFVKTRNSRNNKPSNVKGTEAINVIIKDCLTKFNMQNSNNLKDNTIEAIFFKELKSLNVLTPSLIRFNVYEVNINDQIKDIFYPLSDRSYVITLSKIFEILEDSLISLEIKKLLINTIINYTYSITLISRTNYCKEIRKSIQSIIEKHRALNV